MNKIYRTIIFLLLCIPVIGSAQNGHQVLRGRVVDADTKEPLVGAMVSVINSAPAVGAVTDVDGFFRMAQVPLGRQSIRVSHIGYNEKHLKDLMVTSAKEMVVDVELHENISELQEVVVTATDKRGKALNPMAIVSARSLTVEEANKFAGSMGDPARLVSAYSGVSTGNLQDNSIVVRGNSPQGVAWRIEGVEVFSPHHFAGANVTGGGIVTILSNFVLGTSDFYTSAFPAEYGNALSAIFDMKLRNGNSEQYEHAFQVGVMGIDVASEGPISKKNRSSYLFNYRYSTIGLLSDLKVIQSDQIIKYHDLSFKLNFPTKSAGTFSIWGVGGIDNSIGTVDEDQSKWEVDFDRIKSNWETNMGTLGATHRITIGDAGYLSTTAAYSIYSNKMITKYVQDDFSTIPDMDLINTNQTITLNSIYNHKFSPSTTLRSGVVYRHQFYDYDLSGTQFFMPGTYQKLIEEQGEAVSPELFTQVKHYFSPQWMLQAGLHASYFNLSKEFLIEPRVGLQWIPNSHHVVTLGYGMHSRPEDLRNYLLEINGEQPNKGLKLSKAHHLVLGYDWQVSRNLHFKAEAYYQHQYDVPGEKDSSFAMLNFKQNHTLNKVLENNIIGRNYGLDLTLEQFFDNQFYYLLTGSIFDAKYRGGDGKWYNTRYNKRYVLNLLAGKEFSFKNNRQILDVNGRISLTGGERYTPVLEAESKAAKYIITDDTQAFTKSFPASLYADLTVSYRINHKRASSVFSAQIKNIFGAKIEHGFNYNLITGEIQQDRSQMVIPSISYRLEF